MFQQGRGLNGVLPRSIERALAEDIGRTAQDCHVITTLLVGRREPEEGRGGRMKGIRPANL